MLYHTYYKGGEESHLTYYYFVVTCFVTGVSRTLTPYCGCSFAIVSFFVSIDSLITRHACTGARWCHAYVCTYVRIDVCMCRVSHSCVCALRRRVARLLLFFPNCSPLRHTRPVRKFEAFGFFSYLRRSDF